ncbi:MAG: serine hydrolase [Janthinobacterium lividum]
MKTSVLALLLVAGLQHLVAPAQIAPPVAAPFDVAAVDAVVARTLKAFDVPGIAVAVVKDGQVVLAKGYGVRSLATKAPMDANTLVGIASNTKAFTTAALGLLVDEGKLRWDDKVTKYIPEFQMYDPYATAEFTVRDLLCHCSGLGLGAGDLMQFPDSTDFTAKDVIYNLRYFKPVSSFRSKYDYDNNLYIVAGEVVARIAGQPWADFVEARLLKPLSMSRSATNFSRLLDPTNVSDAHARTGQDRVQEMLGTKQAAAGKTDPALAAVWLQVAAAQKNVPKKPDYRAYVGRYHDAWLGDVNIFAQGNQLWLKAKRSPRLTGQVLPYEGSTRVVRWCDRSFNADAFATFTLDAQGRAASLQLKPVSPATDFSYDFQDLNLRRVE